MKSVKVPAIYGLVTVLAGITAESPHLIFFSMGLSLFIPALLVLTARESSLTALLTSALSLALLALYSLRAPLDVLPFQAMGAVFLKSFRKPELSVLTAALLLFSAAVIEEAVAGLPPEFEKTLGQFRWGLYFATATLFGEAAYGITLLLLKKGELFFRMRFGFWPVPLFFIFGLGSLIGDGLYRLIAVNGLVAVLSIFTAQGIAVILHLVNRTAPLVRLLILITVVIFPLGFLTGAMLLGFLDNWLDFRKLNGGGKDGSNFD